MIILIIIIILGKPILRMRMKIMKRMNGPCFLFTSACPLRVRDDRAGKHGSSNPD